MARRRKRSTIPTDTPELKIEKSNHDGKGIAYFNDKTVFISGAIMGETVKVKFTAKRKGILEAQVTDVIEGSANRVTPPCEFYDLCGGCSLQHLSSDQQIQLKQQSLIDNFKHLAKIELDKSQLLPTLTGPTLAYRSKARLGVRYVVKKEKLLIGFREKSSNYLCEMTSCEVLHPAIGKRLKLLAQVIESLSIYMQIPQVEVAFGDQQAALIFRHLTDMNEQDQQKLIDFGKKTGFYILLQGGGPDSIKMIYPPEKTESSYHLSYALPEFDLNYYFTATDFTQVNRVINRQMVSFAIELLNVKTTDKVLDLFCGIGNFSLALARKSAFVTAVEGSAELIIKAKNNAISNGLENCKFYCADLFINSGKDDFKRQKWAQQHYDAILIDPARSGAKEIMEYIPHFKAATIVYVSCNPATLARDSEILVHQHGYQLVSAGVMDMFPHTSHVESIALFKKNFSTNTKPRK